jgi:hypothetical protein
VARTASPSRDVVTKRTPVWLSKSWRKKGTGFNAAAGGAMDNCPAILTTREGTREELQLDGRTDVVLAFSVTWPALEPVKVRHQLFRLNPVRFFDRVFELCSGPVSEGFNETFTSDQVILECQLSWD